MIPPRKLPGENSCLSKQVEDFSQLLKAEVLEAAFNVWGDPKWPKEGQADLNLTLRLRDGSILNRTFGLDLPQNGIELRDERLEDTQPYSSLPELIELWRQFSEDVDKDMDNAECPGWRALDLRDSKEYGWIIGDSIAAFHLLCSTDCEFQMGIVIDWSSGSHLTLGLDGFDCKVRHGAFFSLPDSNVVRIVVRGFNSQVQHYA